MTFDDVRCERNINIVGNRNTAINCVPFINRGDSVRFLSEGVIAGNVPVISAMATMYVEFTVLDQVGRWVVAQQVELVLGSDPGLGVLTRGPLRL